MARSRRRDRACHDRRHHGHAARAAVRVAATTPWHAKVPLGLGAFGICFPMTTTRSDAEAAVRAVRYPPAGERFWGPFYAPLRWGLTMREYLDRADDEVLAIGTIEHIDAIGTIGDVV